MRRNLLFVTLFFYTIAPSQNILKANLNGYRAGDIIIKQQMEYVSPGMGGKNTIWDFSKLGIVDNDYLLFYYQENDTSTTQIVGWEHQTRYSYDQRNDTLFMLAYRNRSVKMSFEKPELQMIFPFSYEDSVCSEFEGHGLYFQEMRLTAQGRTFIEADGFGVLITPVGDTLRNVLRVKRLRDYEDIGVDGARMSLENHLWYAPGYRYPVFETVKSTTIKNGKSEDDYTTAFYFPLEGMEALENDMGNKEIRETQKQDRGVIISCQVTPNPVESISSIVFELSEEALVSLRLCDTMGNLVNYLTTNERFSAGKHQKTIEMAGLRNGNYVMHIRANNYVTSKLIVKK